MVHEKLLKFKDIWGKLREENVKCDKGLLFNYVKSS